MTADELVQKWGPITRLSDHIFTWTEPHCLAYLAEQASRSEYAVELGTYMGRSASVMMAAGCRHLWTVDKFMVAGTLEVTRHFLRPWMDLGWCEIIVGDSTKAASMLEHMRGKLDLVFVDDGHSTEDVKRDISSFLPLLKSGGLICGHDFDVPHNDVALGVIASLPSFEIPVPRMWAYRKP